MNKKLDIDLLKIILSYNNINSLVIHNNCTEREICILMAKNNEFRKQQWMLEFKQNVEKKRYTENCKKKLYNKLYEFINHCKFIFQVEIIIPENKIKYVNSNAIFFTIDILNYGSFIITIINDNDLWINNICEPECLLDGGYTLDPNNFKMDMDALPSEYYLKKTFKSGDINVIINSIWYTPFWKARMPNSKKYLMTY